MPICVTLAQSSNQLERNLTFVPQTVKRFSHPRHSDARLIEPIKKTRVAEEVADRIRTLILDDAFPQGQRCPRNASLPNSSE